MRYQQAAKLAIGVCEQLQPFCEVINIAGSLRRVSGMRGRDTMEIKDIDLVCVPRFTEVVALELFGESVPTKKISINFIDTIKSVGKIEKGSPDGRYMSLNVRGNKVDLFMPQPWDYYRVYCIRTGSSEYVRWNIATAWLKIGWCGTDQGLRRITDCREVVSATDKKKWEIVNKNGDRPPAWESEEQFYKWLGLEWIHPRFRSI
jgi:DNA polymerase/3'-5' exonuclease PolX